MSPESSKPPSSAFTWRYWITAGVLLGGGVAAAVWWVPGVIRRAWAGRSLPILNRLIVGQEVHPADDYVAAWDRLWPVLAGAGLVAAIGVFLVVRYRATLARLYDRAIARVPPVRPSQLPILLACLGLVLGTIEGIWLDVHRLIAIDSRGEISRHVLWMAPLGGGVLLGTVGLLAWPCSKRWPRACSAGILAVAGATVALSSTISALSLGGVHAWAANLLALGIAVQLYSFSAKRIDATLRVVRRLAAALVVWIGVSAAGVFGVERVSELRALAGLPPLANAPNILLIILDTVRSPNLSLYGYERPTTPNLERIGEQGVVFDRAVAPSSWTLPSHATMFTGRFAHDVGTGWHVPLDDARPTLAEVLRDRGYETVGIVANLSYTTRESGLRRGFIHYEDQPGSPAAIRSQHPLSIRIANRIAALTGSHRHSVRKRAPEVSGRLLRWLSRRDGDRPFFAFLNYLDAHDPYDLPRGREARFARPGARYWLDEGRGGYLPHELRDLVDTYDDAIAYLDEEIGHLFDELDRRGELDNTILVIVSDHGEQFGERDPDLVMHGNSLYLTSIHVPLIVRYPPGVPAGRRVADWVSLRDLPATLLDLAGAPPALPGHSLAASWDSTRSTPGSLPFSEVVPPGHDNTTGPLESVIVDRWHFIRPTNGDPELYDGFDDPFELTDLAGSDIGRARVPPFAALVDSIVTGIEPGKR